MVHHGRKIILLYFLIIHMYQCYTFSPIVSVFHITLKIAIEQRKIAVV